VISDMRTRVPKGFIKVAVSPSVGRHGLLG
jgi:hypothetical protein